MVYDQRLAARIRELTAKKRGVTEKEMFGGLAFLINGNMAVAASGQGGLLLRADPEDGSLIAAGARPMVMRGRAMAGWLRVDADRLRTKAQLEKWVTGATTYAASLAPKRDQPAGRARAPRAKSRPLR